jgi:hypothetical protein
METIMSLLTFAQSATHRAPRSSVARRRFRFVRAHLARRVGFALREAGTFVLTMTILAAIMAALAAFDVMIWLPRIH